MMNKMSIKKGDTVAVITGKDKGQRGKVLSVNPKEGKVVVEKINLVSRHTQPPQAGRGRRHPAEGSPPVCLQGDARVPQVRQDHPCRQQDRGRQEGARVQALRC